MVGPAGSGSSSFFANRARRPSYGLTTPKYTIVARITNATSAVRNWPTLIGPMATVSKFGLPPIRPMMSRTILVKVVTTVPKEVAMITATASSTRLPRMMKSLKPFMVFLRSLW